MEEIDFLGGPLDGYTSIVFTGNPADNLLGYILFVCSDGSYQYLWEDITRIDYGD